MDNTKAKSNKSWKSTERHKPFKGKHKGKSTNNSKGRTLVLKGSTIQSKTLSKHDRKNQAKLIQKKKREELLLKSRIFHEGVPKNVVVIPLGPDTNAFSAVKKWVRSEMEIHHPVIYQASKFSTSINYIPCERRLLDILKVSMIADFIIFVVSSEIGMDEWGEQCQSTLKAQGLVTTIPIIQHLESKNDIHLIKSKKKEWLSYFTANYNLDTIKIYAENEIDEIERIISQHQVKLIAWRNFHPYLVSNEIEYCPYEQTPELGCLKVSGFIRGSPFSAHKMIHIPDFGDFHLEKMDRPCKSSKALNDREEMEVEENRSFTTVQYCESLDDQVKDEANGDNDNPIPRGETLNSVVEKKRTIVKVPKGTSEYQASWIIDSSDASSVEADPPISDMDVIRQENEEINLQSTENTTMLLDDDMDMELYDSVQIEKDLENYRRQKLLASQEDLEFPDEVVIPEGESAREKFKKYRGLKSFKYSDWSPLENLPKEYARIYQFENFKASQKKALNEIDSPFEVGQHVCLYIRNTSKEMYDKIKLSCYPLIVFGLLKYEDKTSVLHFTVNRQGYYSEPIQSKEPFFLVIGFRRHIITPVFSELSAGNLHKYHRFIQPGEANIASVYLPILFGEPPTLLFKLGELFHDHLTYTEEPMILVSTGSLMSIDPQRMIIKRITLTGHPFKIHKKSVVIRHMFFSPEDVQYFKPVSLMTKFGKHGHIKDSIGTHGYLKAVFEKQIQQQDTVCLHLYKRIFPKVPTLPHDHSSLLITTFQH